MFDQGEHLLFVGFLAMIEVPRQVLQPNLANQFGNHARLDAAGDGILKLCGEFLLGRGRRLLANAFAHHCVHDGHRMLRLLLGQGDQLIAAGLLFVLEFDHGGDAEQQYLPRVMQRQSGLDFLAGLVELLGQESSRAFTSWTLPSTKRSRRSSGLALKARWKNSRAWSSRPALIASEPMPSRAAACSGKRCRNASPTFQAASCSPCPTR